MKRFSVKLLIVMFSSSLFTSVNAEAEVAISAIDSAILDSIVANEQVVVFGGIKYKYKIDEKQSMLYVDEAEPKPLRISELKVGQKYHFEKVIYKKLNKEPSVNDFKDIIFITDSKSMVIE
ncbi:MAG: hypothetical protein KDI92_12570 [Xanthomonadales bacterium]|nr:hypothetical protein [Xanthomonadales bacterium]